MALFIAANVLEKCSPVLRHKKPSILIMLEKEDLDLTLNTDAIWHLTMKGIGIRFLGSYKKRERVLIYQRKALEEILNSTEKRKLLEYFGYRRSLSLEQILDTLENRFSQETDLCFPHELGVILGYSTDEIVHCIEHQTKNYHQRQKENSYQDEVKKVHFYSAFKKCQERNAKILEASLIEKETEQNGSLSKAQ